MKKYTGILLLSLLLAGCTEETNNSNTPVVTVPLQEDISQTPDGIYRGFYYDYGSEQVAIEFEIQNNCFTEISYRNLTYKNTDYLNNTTSDNEKAVVLQFEELKDYLLGKDISAIDDLYSPTNIVKDIDTVTSATLPANTLISALQNGLHRSVYKPIETTVLHTEISEPDGTYRGFYDDRNLEQVSVHFTVKDNRFTTFTFRALTYTDGNYLSDEATPKQKEIAEQFEDCAQYLIGKDLSSLNDLYSPQNITFDTDLVSSATLKTGKMISAVNDAFNRGLYKSDNNTYSVVEECEDGIYRGFYYDSGLEQICVQFTVKDNTFEDFSIRGLNYKDGTYLADNATTVQRSIAGQFQQCAEYLKGKHITSVTDLYHPEEIASNADAVTSATLRSNKMVSAINDAFSRGVYRIEQ